MTYSKRYRKVYRTYSIQQEIKTNLYSSFFLSILPKNFSAHLDWWPHFFLRPGEHGS